MNKRESLEKCLELWEHIRDNFKIYKKYRSVSVLKRSVYKTLNWSSSQTSCPACEYKLRHPAYCFRDCIVKWRGYWCLAPKSPYEIFSKHLFKGTARKRHVDAILRDIRRSLDGYNARCK